MQDPVLTVGQFLDGMNALLRESQVFVRGEIAEFKSTAQWTSFTLKDEHERAVLRCVTGTWQFKKMGVPLADGMAVKVGGVPRITKSYGSFGLWFDTVEPLGQGSLKQAYDLLLKRLQAEGLFARKRSLPECIERIGVVTSKSGVVIEDFRRNLRKLGYRITFADARVEGAQAVSSILAAIETLSRRDLDVLVVIRGGGSLESMQAWNNEEVCRALFASRVPVLAGIGHEVDVPIASLVADVAVSTPTAAAVVINESWRRVREELAVHERGIPAAFSQMLVRARQETAVSVSTIVHSFRRVFAAADRYGFAVRFWVKRVADEITRARTQVEHAARLISLGDPERNLRRGYGIVFAPDGRVAKSVRAFTRGNGMRTRLADGEIESSVTDVYTARV